MLIYLNSEWLLYLRDIKYKLTELPFRHKSER